MSKRTTNICGFLGALLLCAPMALPLFYKAFPNSPYGSTLEKATLKLLFALTGVSFALSMAATRRASKWWLLLAIPAAASFAGAIYLGFFVNID